MRNFVLTFNTAKRPEEKQQLRCSDENKIPARRTCEWDKCLLACTACWYSLIKSHTEPQRSQRKKIVTVHITALKLFLNHETHEKNAVT